MTKSDTTNFTFKYGLISALVLIIFSLLSYFFNFQYKYEMLTGWVSIPVIFILSLFCISDYAKTKESLTYGAAAKIGFKCLFIASILYGFYVLFYANFIASDFFSEFLRLKEEAFIERGMPKEIIIKTLKTLDLLSKPHISFLSTVFVITFFGGIFSLIGAVFFQKNN